MFYLNYVGCKDVAITYPASESYNMFYLNYVGCKGQCMVPTKCLLSGFYLNYVGCKESFLKVGLFRGLRFI